MLIEIYRLLASTPVAVALTAWEEAGPKVSIYRSEDPHKRCYPPVTATPSLGFGCTSVNVGSGGCGARGGPDYSLVTGQSFI